MVDGALRLNGEVKIVNESRLILLFFDREICEMRETWDDTSFLTTNLALRLNLEC